MDKWKKEVIYLTKKFWLSSLMAVFLLPLLWVAFSVYPRDSSAEEPATFSSSQELSEYLELSRRLAGYFNGWTGNDRAMNPSGGRIEIDYFKAESSPLEPQKEVADYSETNTQVQGVDEGDMVKTDGNYLYVLGSNKLSILKGYPVEEAGKISEILLDGRPLEIFLNGDKLVVFGQTKQYREAFIHRYNIADRQNPVLEQNISCPGYYITSRRIGQDVYAVVQAPVRQYDYESKDSINFPEIRVNNQTQVVPPGEIHHFNHWDHSYRYTFLLSLNLQDPSGKVARKVFLTGTSQNIYASPENLYLTGPKTPDYTQRIHQFLQEITSLLPVELAQKVNELRNSNLSEVEKYEQVMNALEDYFNTHPNNQKIEEQLAQYMDKWQRQVSQDRDGTVIYKLALGQGQVVFKTKGEVKGQPLNQFSMDEYNGYFRIATTSQDLRFSGQRETRNNLYVLNADLQLTGKITGLAPTEKIYSARFMGSKAYLVTFRQIDPLFVIDLKDPQHPQVMGELKIPGYSDYLHPYDENHLIGIGREAFAGTEPLPPQERIVLPQVGGVKVALFDVTTPSAPKEISKYVVSRGDADSPALRDHRAVLFSKEKNLLAIPIHYRPLRIINPLEKKAVNRDWQGVFVFNLTPQKGIQLKGTVEHSSPGQLYSPVQRSLYIGEYLYTLSEQRVKINRLDNLQEIKDIPL
ncbi:beta-propeller domain-containing protein [Desulforamulus ruminis]|uniref:beta-propeller domain-containing protein n=1 Tax=Desulforamulus ruminis TaxID=1564 RepID=UPI000674AD7B|nr:beta-propeller domain-containing protein [Desulforamulus ruminis]